MNDTSLPYSVTEDLSQPRWEFDCCDCDLFDTYGYEDIRMRAFDHVRETGHTVAVWSKRWGHLRPSSELAREF